MKTDRDPGIDHPDELYPETRHVEDLSDVLTITGSGATRRLQQVVGDNVDDDGVAHHLLITPDPEEPDICGGCRKVWPCGKGQPLQVIEQPRLDPGLVAAVAEALRQERAEGRLAL